jgi:hypothetical protein
MIQQTDRQIAAERQTGSGLFFNVHGVGFIPEKTERCIGPSRKPKVKYLIYIINICLFHEKAPAGDPAGAFRMKIRRVLAGLGDRDRKGR